MTHLTQVPGTPREEPKDGYGVEYQLHCLRSDFIDLCRLIGFENARNEVAEIIHSEADRKRQ